MKVYNYAMYRKRSMGFILSCGVAGAIAGCGATSFGAAALGAVAASWCNWILATFPPILFINLDRQANSPELLPDALRFALDQVISQRTPLLARISTPRDDAECTMHLDQSSDIAITRPGLRTTHLQRKGRWIAEHPTPLVLVPGKALILRMQPTGRGRVRVALPPPPTLTTPLWTALVILSTVALLRDLPWLLALSLGFAFQSGTAKYQQSRDHIGKEASLVLS